MTNIDEETKQYKRAIQLPKRFSPRMKKLKKLIDKINRLKIKPVKLTQRQKNKLKKQRQKNRGKK